MTCPPLAGRSRRTTGGSATGVAATGRVSRDDRPARGAPGLARESLLVSDRQLDLFSGSGIAPVRRASPATTSPGPSPAERDDAALLAAIPASHLSDGPALAAEAGRRGLHAAIPMLEAYCRRFAGFGARRILPEQVAAWMRSRRSADLMRHTAWRGSSADPGCGSDTGRRSGGRRAPRIAFASGHRAYAAASRRSCDPGDAPAGTVGGSQVIATLTDLLGDLHRGVSVEAAARWAPGAPGGRAAAQVRLAPGAVIAGDRSGATDRRRGMHRPPRQDRPGGTAGPRGGRIQCPRGGGAPDGREAARAPGAMTRGSVAEVAALRTPPACCSLPGPMLDAARRSGRPVSHPRPRPCAAPAQGTARGPQWHDNWRYDDRIRRRTNRPLRRGALCPRR